MYRAGANDKTWMYTMQQPFPSFTAPGRWDTTPVKGFVPSYYGPDVPPDYLCPYLYGADAPAITPRDAWIAGASVVVGGLLGFWLGRRSR